MITSTWFQLQYGIHLNYGLLLKSYGKFFIKKYERLVNNLVYGNEFINYPSVLNYVFCNQCQLSHTRINMH